MKEPCKKGNWQGERERRLNRACLLIQAAISRGETARKAIRRMAGRYNGRPYKSDPRRCMALARTTLRGLFYKWKRGGELSAVFRLNYGAHGVFTYWMLIRFLNFLVKCPQPNLKAAFERFTARGRGFSAGQRGVMPVKISYWQLQSHFGQENFRLIRAQQRAMNDAQRKLGGLKLSLAAEFERRFPARQPHAGRRNDFHI